MGRQYNANHLGNSKHYQVQETNWYEISIGGTSQDLTFMVQSCTLPELSNPVIGVGYGNSTAKVAGKREVGDSTFSFMDAMVADIESQILKWQDQVYDSKTGKMGWCTDYKRQVTVTQYGPDGSYERTWKFEGCWPSRVSYGSLSGESADKKVIQVTITYDDAKRE